MTQPEPRTDDPIARVTNLRKRYDTLTAVDGVSFEIRRGEIFGLLGPNGAGKTTTISILGGILQPTEGEVIVAGYDARQASVPMKQTLGVVPQELAVYMKLTGRENLDFFGRLYGMHGQTLHDRVDEMLNLVGLSDRANDRTEKYSGGMKRRLNLAAGLMHNPRLLLLDEPTVGVDPQSRNHIFEGVRELNRKGLTVLYTSHYMEEVEALCDRVGIMDHGKLVACDTVPGLISQLGGAVIEIGLAGAEPTAENLAALRALDSVDEAESIQDPEAGTFTLRVRSRRSDEALPVLIAALGEMGLSLQTLTIKQPNLEDVFLALTGKTLRD